MFIYRQLNKNKYDEGTTRTKLLNTFSHTIHKFPSLKGNKTFHFNFKNESIRGVLIISGLKLNISFKISIIYFPMKVFHMHMSRISTNI